MSELVTSKKFLPKPIAVGDVQHLLTTIPQHPEFKNVDYTELDAILSRSPFRFASVCTKEMEKDVLISKSPSYYGQVANEFKHNEHTGHYYGRPTNNHLPAVTNIDNLAYASDTLGLYQYQSKILQSPADKPICGVYLLPVEREYQKQNKLLKHLSKPKLLNSRVTLGEQFSMSTMDEESNYVLAIKGSFGPGVPVAHTLPIDTIYLELTSFDDALGIVKFLKQANSDEISSKELLAHLIFSKETAKKIVKIPKEKLNPSLTDSVQFVIPSDLGDMTT